MENITSRKNAYIRHLRELASSPEYRASSGEFLCDTGKLLQEAVQSGAEITSVLWKGNVTEGLSSVTGSMDGGIPEYTAPAELFDYVSPMKNSPGPIFTCAVPAAVSLSGQKKDDIKNALILENVQDPGNVGTVLRTANAFGISAVILTGACADLYSPKTVRATMGAIFRQKVIRAELDELQSFLAGSGLPLYGAVLSSRAVSVRETDLTHAAVAVGSEGKGLSAKFRSMCDGEVIIPMQPGSESLNAAMAGTILMWEMSG